ncbi:hypothetical protein [Micromonospora sp. NPDC048063]|uniref:hypothetical protein n=1 Tax=Micromonospora sp. NPDC048063 TaxID=3364256 RepID=UPI0037238B94
MTAADGVRRGRRRAGSVPRDGNGPSRGQMISSAAAASIPQLPKMCKKGPGAARK